MPRNDGNGAFFNDSPITVVNGSSGQYKWSMPQQGNADKKVLIYFNEYQNTIKSTITFPTPFDIQPIVDANNVSYVSGPVIQTITPTAITFNTITDASVTGFIILEGM